MTALDVVGIGNALVDVISEESFDFLARHGLVSGTMALVDSEQTTRLYADMGPTLQVSGGSAANTMVGVAALGGRAGFVGRIAADEFGDVFTHDIQSAGVEFFPARAGDGAPTGHCLVVVTPDAQRTMSTFLGASALLSASDLDEGRIASAQILYLEGYLWDDPVAKAAYRHAATTARRAGVRVALSLSDPFCVARHRDDFLDLVATHVDVLFANELEITTLYGTASFDGALQAVRDECEVAALTRGAAGAIVVGRGETHVVDACALDGVVDTTGAGDLFAAGFLYGFTQGYDLGTAGRLGALAAGEIIGHLGARPATSLRDLAAPIIGVR